MSACSHIEPIKFYKENMSGKGRGKTKRDMIDAPVIRAAPGKVKSKGNIHKKAKNNAEAKKAASKTPARSRSKKVAKKSDHQISSSSSSSSEDEEVGGCRGRNIL